MNSRSRRVKRRLRAFGDSENKIFSITVLMVDGKLRATLGSDIKNTPERKMADELITVTVVDCFHFIPHHPSMFKDRVLHPSNDGFEYYAENAIREIKKSLRY